MMKRDIHLIFYKSHGGKIFPYSSNKPKEKRSAVQLEIYFPFAFFSPFPFLTT